ncbi:hypothetical protein B0H11DRAFT_1900156 [Mycena galericulata]|nr:hypothetical protein B0H11DRAFT_1900156 [Mycena galericulata]
MATSEPGGRDPGRHGQRTMSEVELSSTESGLPTCNLRLRVKKEGHRGLCNLLASAYRTGFQHVEVVWSLWSGGVRLGVAAAAPHFEGTTCIIAADTRVPGASTIVCKIGRPASVTDGIPVQRVVLRIGRARGTGGGRSPLVAGATRLLKSCRESVCSVAPPRIMWHGGIGGAEVEEVWRFGKGGAVGGRVCARSASGPVRIRHTEAASEEDEHRSGGNRGTEAAGLGGFLARRTSSDG